MHEWGHPADSLPPGRQAASSGGHPTDGRRQSGQCSGGRPTTTQSGNSRGGFVSALHRATKGALARHLDAADHSARVREHPAVASPTWVVDTGASYEVVPAGIAEAKSWDRASLRGPLGISTAMGRIVHARSRAPRAWDAREDTCGGDAQYPDVDIRGRRCLSHGYSFAWHAGRTS